MSGYQIIGLVCLIFLFIIFLFSSIHYGTPYPLVCFFILMIVGGLLARTLFRKERKHLKKKKKTEEIPGWNLFKKTSIYIMLIVIIGIPLLSIPSYLAGTLTLNYKYLAAYVAFIATFGVFGVLSAIVIRKKPEYMFSFPINDITFLLTLILVTLASLGTFVLLYLFLLSLL
jgi:MFS family permease